MISPTRRLAALPLLALAFLALTFGTAACGGNGSGTSCSLNACTVTFDRGVDAEASILGVKAELVGVRDDMVTLRIAGQTVSVPTGGQSSADGYRVSVQSVTEKQVIVKISRAG